MSSLSQFSSVGKPLRTVEYTSGTGTFTPLTVGNWLRVTLVGGGGGGGKASTATDTNGAAGGSASAVREEEFKCTGPVDYSVGAGGLGRTGTAGTGSNGSRTVFGLVMVPGGNGGTDSTTDTPGGFVFSSPASNQQTSVDGLGGGAGGGGGAPGGGGTGGGSGVTGKYPGFGDNTGLTTGPVLGGVAANNGKGGGGGGGCSLYGVGGAGSNPSNGTSANGVSATGYGAGGGGSGGGGLGTGDGGNGSGGYIIVQEFAP